MSAEYSTPGPDLLRQLVEEAELPRSFSSFYQTPKGPLETAQPYRLLDALGLESKDLSDIAAKTLEALEDLGKGPSSDWLDFCWKLSAFVHVQDIFDSSLHEGKDLRMLFQQYYFYYESRIILAECVLAGLNGLYVASDALLRPFLEFSLFQNYYYRVTRDSGSYAAIETYFTNKRQLSWGAAMKKALPKYPFCRPIKFRINAHLAGLSETTQHAYHPDSSVLQHRHKQHGHSVEGVFFWYKIRIILESVLWLYYANFPLLFQPIDVLRKFGFNGPVGVFADLLTGHFVRKSLSEADYEAFKAYSEQAGLSPIEWARSRNDLTDTEILATWNSEENGSCPDDLQMAYGMHMARLRALRIGMAFRAAKRLDDLPDEFLESIRTLKGWSVLAGRGPIRHSHD